MFLIIFNNDYYISDYAISKLYILFIYSNIQIYSNDI